MSSQKTVLFITLKDYSYMDDSYFELMTTLRSRCYVHRAETLWGAKAALRGNQIAGVLFYEPSIISLAAGGKDEGLVEMLVEYTQKGGTMIFGCICAAEVQWPALNKFFVKNWGLPWKMQSYGKDDYSLNSNAAVRLEHGLAEKYLMKAVCLGGVANEDLVYVAMHDDDEDEDELKSQEPKTEGPIVCRKYGQGRLGWIGDVNSHDKNTTLVMLKMLGL